MTIYDSIESRYHVGEVIGKGSFGQVCIGTPTLKSIRDYPNLDAPGMVVCVLLYFIRLSKHLNL